MTIPWTGTWHRAGQRRGAALAMALVALVVVAGLGAGVALAAREADRSARDELARVRADAHAAGAVEAVVRAWDRRRNQLRVGIVDPVRELADPAAVARVVRLDRTRFLVEAGARARAAAGPAERTVAALVRLVPPSVNALAAVTSGGSLTLLGDAIVDGHDAAPPGWTDCPAAAADTAAIATRAAGDVHLGPQAIVHGGIRQQTEAAVPATYSTFGADDWSSLAARADVAVDASGDPLLDARAPAPTAHGDDCVMSSDAWSEPLRGSGAVDACASTYPMMLGRGGLTLRGGRGQGVLLVDGDLVVNGIVTFAGAVVVRGSLRGEHGALRLHGALLVHGNVTMGPGSHVRFSRCAVMRALDGIARVSALRRRSWAEVTR